MVIVYFNVQGVVDPRDGHCFFVACGRMKLTDPNRKLCRQNGAT